MIPREDERAPTETARVCMHLSRHLVGAVEQPDPQAVQPHVRFAVVLDVYLRVPGRLLVRRDRAGRIERDDSDAVYRELRRFLDIEAVLWLEQGLVGQGVLGAPDPDRGTVPPGRQILRNRDRAEVEGSCARWDTASPIPVEAGQVGPHPVRKGQPCGIGNAFDGGAACVLDADLEGDRATLAHRRRLEGPRRIGNLRRRLDQHLVGEKDSLMEWSPVLGACQLDRDGI